MKIYCDKCKKVGVIERLKYPPPEPEYTMQDIIDGKNEGSGWTTADIKWFDYILECPFCGYCREYSRGSGGIRPVIIRNSSEEK